MKCSICQPRYAVYLQALEVDLATYDSMIHSLGKEAAEIARQDPVEGREVVAKQKDLESQLANFQDACAKRKHQLTESKLMHNYMRETDELEQWIGDQMQIASSEDYGQDYEHLQVLQAVINWAFKVTPYVDKELGHDWLR